MKIAALLLAAGSSSRLGRPKQLLSVAGIPLIRRLAERALASRCAQLGVVVGSGAKDVVRALDGLPIDVICNSGWKEGMGSSIRAGVAWAESQDCDGVLLLVCDQPFLSTKLIDRMIDAFAIDRLTIASRYGDTLGTPALFDRSSFSQLSKLRGTRGARDVLRNSELLVAIDFPEGAIDIDTEADVREHLAASGE